MKKTLLSISLASLISTLAGPVMALEQRSILTLDLAKKMAAGCEEKARKGGSKMNIAILDIGGNEKYFLRQDDAFLKSGQIAHMKASTSAGLPFSTKQVGQLAPACRASHSSPAS